MASRSPVTCHVLDQAAGRPAAGVTVTLEKLSSAVPLAAAARGGPADWEVLAVGRTDADGRCTTLLDPAVPPDAGVYRATFDVQEYFEARGTQTFYPFVQNSRREAQSNVRSLVVRSAEQKAVAAATLPGLKSADEPWLDGRKRHKYEPAHIPSVITFRVEFDTGAVPHMTASEPAMSGRFPGGNSHPDF
ncbi:MAG: hypothetical protein BJ554DRAFT_823 [Olpidium bornovanus]|uniref:Transthyretin/hydroxyisourate hydrolase domain-containing protein n=1 Tax=Olpidium bornovanus TaxID=278681 RepID=A0A8H8DI99_9FUNG|nr:MAG: hypothetical protein BJ554DRAFT_823 [Olpidium bornovanus]